VLSALAADSGIPSEAEFVADYCRVAGRAPDLDLRFYLAFSMFRYVSIIQGVYKRALNGNASSGAAARGSRGRVEYAANVAWQLVKN
jgi:aminoglycoside phosphotransferase (APT) family kinase protein